MKVKGIERHGSVPQRTTRHADARSRRQKDIDANRSFAVIPEKNERRGSEIDERKVGAASARPAAHYTRAGEKRHLLLGGEGVRAHVVRRGGPLAVAF
jgi:hypothetical protein